MDKAVAAPMAEGNPDFSETKWNPPEVMVDLREKSSTPDLLKVDLLRKSTVGTEGLLGIVGDLQVAQNRHF